MAPNIETPNEPPIERKNVAALLETPRSFCSTLFCAMSIVRLHEEAHAEAEYGDVEARPPAGRGDVHGRQQPHGHGHADAAEHRVDLVPARGGDGPANNSETTMAEPIIGSNSRPELVAEAP